MRFDGVSEFSQTRLAKLVESAEFTSSLDDDIRKPFTKQKLISAYDTKNRQTGATAD